MPSSSFSVQQDITDELDSFVKKEKLKSRTEGIKLMLVIINELLDSFVKKEKLKSRAEGIKLLLQRHKDKS